MRLRRAVGTPRSLGLVHQQRVHVTPGEPLTPVEERELDQEAAADDIAAELLDEVAQRRGRAAGREQVVVHEHPPPGGDGVGVQLERLLAVLEQVFGADGLIGQLAGLAREREAGAELERERGAEQEAARLGRDDALDLQRPRVGGQAVPRPQPARRSAISGVMSLKLMPGLGEVGYVANQRAQVDRLARLAVLIT